MTDDMLKHVGIVARALRYSLVRLSTMDAARGNLHSAEQSFNRLVEHIQSLEKEQP